MHLSDIKPGIALVGLETDRVCTVVAATVIADNAVQVFYKLPDGTLKERLLGPVDEASIGPATAERPWAFDGEAADFQLACEAKRIDLAFLFDPMMAVHTSNVEPLPHQITAVYESMLPRQPLRYVLADDPGAGKTIMAGLYIRELIMRADARRVPDRRARQPGRAVARRAVREVRPRVPGVLAGPNSSRHRLRVTPSRTTTSLWCASTRWRATRRCRQQLCAAESWDLVVFDEAHKLAAHFFGAKLEKTGRFQLAEEIGKHTRHLLLMTATPHNGKEEDFQLFLSLLDSDRFYGKFRDGASTRSTRPT